MHVISKKRLKEFWTLHDQAEPALTEWFKVVRKQKWLTFAEVREVYPSADQVEHLTVFNIGGNKHRLVAFIDFKRGKLYIRNVLTHADYNRGKWKDDEFGSDWK